MREISFDWKVTTWCGRLWLLFGVDSLLQTFLFHSFATNLVRLLLNVEIEFYVDYVIYQVFSCVSFERSTWTSKWGSFESGNLNRKFSYARLQVYTTEVQYFKTIEGRTASKIGMRLQLQSIHFGGGPGMNGGGQLVLRCTAQIGNLYQEYTEKEVGLPQKDPIPARGK